MSSPDSKSPDVVGLDSSRIDVNNETDDFNNADKYYEERVMNKSVAPLLKSASMSVPKETFSIREIETIIEEDRGLRTQLAQEKKKKFYFSVIFGIIALAGILVGCAVAGYKLASDTSVDGDSDVMKSKSTGQPVQVASTDMTVNGGVLSTRDSGGDLLTGQLSYNIDSEESSALMSAIAMSSSSPCGSVLCSIDQFLEGGYTLASTQSCDTSNNQLKMVKNHGVNKALIHISNSGRVATRSFESDGYQTSAEYTLINAVPVTASYVDEKYVIYIPAEAVAVTPYDGCLSPILRYPIQNVTYANSSFVGSGRRLTAGLPLTNYYNFDINTLEDGMDIDCHLAQRIMEEPVRSGKNIPLPLHLAGQGHKIAAGIEVLERLKDGFGARLKYHYHVPILDLPTLRGIMLCDEDPRDSNSCLSCKLYLDDYHIDFMRRRLFETFLLDREDLIFVQSYEDVSKCRASCAPVLLDDSKPYGVDYFVTVNRNGVCWNTQGFIKGDKWPTTRITNDIVFDRPVFIDRRSSECASLYTQLDKSSYEGRHCWTCTNTYRKVCFHGSSQVELSSGIAKDIMDVKVGEYVKVYEPSTKSFFFSEVVAFPHERNMKPNDFYRVVTSKRAMVGVTPDHLVLSGSCSADASSFTLQAAQSLSIGSCMLSEDGKETIMDLKQYRSQGVYTIATMRGLPVIDGLVASPFEINHMVPNAFYNIHRLVFSLFPRPLMHWYQPYLVFLVAIADNLAAKAPSWILKCLEV